MDYHRRPPRSRQIYPMRCLDQALLLRNIACCSKIGKMVWMENFIGLEFREYELFDAVNFQPSGTFSMVF